MIRFRHLDLVCELVIREFSSKYRGSSAGLVWTLIHPLLMLCVYTIAFGLILKARWGFPGGTQEYALMLFAGLIVFNSFSEILNKSPSEITSKPNFVRKIVFPLECLTLVSVCVSIIHAFIGIVVWLLAYAFLIGTPNNTVILFPLVFLCFFPFLLAVGWIVSAVGVLVRDVAQLVGVISQAMLFLTPIFYSIEAAPDSLQVLLRLNPLTFIVEHLRLVLFYGLVPPLKGLLLYFTLSSLFASVAYWFFRRIKPQFPDLL